MGVPLKPGHLFFGVDAGISFHFFNGGFPGPGTVQIGEEFFITDGIQGIQVFIRIHPTDFVQQSLGDHSVDPSMDAFEQFPPFSFEACFYNAERALFAGARWVFD